jgi:hypothetical protein
VKMITADNDRVRSVLENLLKKQRGHIADLQKEIEVATRVKESTDGNEEEQEEGDEEETENSD